MNRKQRRQAERDQRKRERTAPTHDPHRQVVIINDGMLAREGGVTFEANPMAAMPPKEPGKHRWVATVAYRVSEEFVRENLAYQGGGPKPAPSYFDNESMLHLGLGCFDCEQILAEGHATPDTRCPAGDEWGDDR